MADERVSQDVNGQIDKVGNVATNAAMNAGKKGAKKLAKKAGKAAGKALKATGKLLVKAGSALINGFMALLPFIWPALVVLIIIVIIVFAYNKLFYNSRIESGSFQDENQGFYADIEYDDFGNITSINSNYESDLAALFYTKYAQQSYYYMIDDDLTLKQAGTQSEDIKDIDGRENLFLLNPQLLSVLDQELNGDYKIPEQFIKPVYHKCSKVNDKVSCTLEKLTDNNGNLIVESTKYGDITDKDDYKFQNIYERTNEKIKGVWDWGLSPIIHYSSFTESSYVPKLSLSEVTIIENGEEVKKNFVDLTNEEKTKFGYDTILTQISSAGKVTRGDSKYDSSNQIPANKKIYVIDNVITFAGEITNNTKEEDIVTGNLTTILNQDYEEETIATNDMYSNQTIIKTVYGPNGNVYENVKTILFSSQTDVTEYELTTDDEIEISSYCSSNSGGDFAVYTTCMEERRKEIIEERSEKTVTNGVYIDGRFISGEASQFKVTYMKKYSLPYVVEGTIYTNTLVYSEQNPDTSQLSETTYLMDYIENYSTFAEIDNVNTVKYGCYKIDETLSNTISNGYLKSLESWNNLNLSKQQILNKIENGTFEKVSEVFDPSECSNNQIALRIDSGEMTSFYLGEMPDIQKFIGASILGYDLTNDSPGVFENTESEEIKNELGEIEDKSSETLTVSTIKVNDKTIKSIVRDTANKYRLDETWLLSIVAAQTNGNFSSTNTNAGCLKSEAGCGALGIKYDSETVSYFDYSKEKKTSMILNDVDYSDIEKSIDALGAILQSYLEEYDFNFLVATQALDYGKKAMDKVIGTAAFDMGYTLIQSDTSALYPLNDITKIDWVYYRKNIFDTYEPGNNTTKPSTPEMLEKILSYLSPAYKVRVWNSKNNSYIAKSWSVLKDKTNSYILGSAAVQSTDKAINTYELNKENFEKTWDVLFFGQKDYNSGTYDLSTENPTKNPKYGLYVEGEAKSEELSGKIIQLIFAYYDGKNIEEYEDMTLADYKVRLVNMFQIGNRYKYDENYDISLLIPTATVNKPADDFEISRGYGHAVDKETGQRGYYENIELMVNPSSKIYSISDGVVEAIQKTQDGYYTIITSHTGQIYNQETGIPERESTTLITYSNLSKVENNIKRGDEVIAGQVIGMTDEVNDKIQIQMSQDGMTLNSEAIMNYIMVKYDMISIHFGKVASYSDKWIAPVLKTYKLNAGTWNYPASFGGARHIGADIAFANGVETIGQSLVAPFSGTIVYTNDTCPYGYYGSRCGGGLGNSVVLAGEVEGTTYVVIFMHMNKGSIPVHRGQTVEQGALIGEAGSSGNSTGPHLHYEIIMMEGMSVDETIDYYKTTSDYLYMNGLPYKHDKMICNETNIRKYCRIRPEDIYNWKYDGGATTYEPDITTPR